MTDVGKLPPGDMSEHRKRNHSVIRLDEQMRAWAPRLRDDIRVSVEASQSLASAIVDDVAALPIEARASLRSGGPIGLRERLDELVAFQAFVDFASPISNAPALTRAHVIVQNYVCFVYLGESCFKDLRASAPSASTLRRCCQFLTDNPIRAFRNAVAHANWRYNEDFTGIRFWARKGDDPKADMVEFTVSQNDLNFWQSLARCTAYAAYTTLEAQ